MLKKSSRKWINQRLSAKIGRPQYNEFWNFVILWNIFEANVFGCRFTSSVAELQSANWGVDSNVVTQTFDCFKSRYTTNGNVNQYFDNLGFRNIPWNKDPNVPTAVEKKVKSILENVNCSVADMVYANVIIISRYRNNFFHGSKKLQGITAQKPNFEAANKFLIACIESNDKKILNP